MMQANPFFLLFCAPLKSNLLIICCCLLSSVGVGGLVSFVFLLTVWLQQQSFFKIIVLHFWITNFLHIDDSCQHSLVTYKWVLEAFETAKVSQCWRRTRKIHVLFVPWDIGALNRKANNLICSLPISMFLFLFLLHQNENQLFISS